jgi:hypothetical protein
MKIQMSWGSAFGEIYLKIIGRFISVRYNKNTTVTVKRYCRIHLICQKDLSVLDLSVLWGNAQGIALHLLSDPPSPLYFISTIKISCYATLPLLSSSQSSFVAIIFIALLFVPIIYCCSTPCFLLIFVPNPALCCPCLLPLPSSIFVYGIWLLLHSLYFYPTSHKVSLSSIFPLPLHPYFLAHVCSIICSFSILLLLIPILCTLIVIVLAVLSIPFDTVTPVYVAMT